MRRIGPCATPDTVSLSPNTKRVGQPPVLQQLPSGRDCGAGPSACDFVYAGSAVRERRRCPAGGHDGSERISVQSGRSRSAVHAGNGFATARGSARPDRRHQFVQGVDFVAALVMRFLSIAICTRVMIVNLEDDLKVQLNP